MYSIYLLVIEDSDGVQIPIQGFPTLAAAGAEKERRENIPEVVDSLFFLQARYRIVPVEFKGDIK